MKRAVIDDRFQPFRSSCTGCKHFDIETNTCPAYPKGIPTVILTGEVLHTSVLKGQTGILVKENEDYLPKKSYFGFHLM
jgi:hypothetical protein